MSATKPITSAANARFKQLLKLAHSSRERRAANLSLLDGVHLLQAYRQCAGEPREIVVSETGLRNTEITALLQGAKAEVLPLSDALFNQLSSVASPTGVIAVITTPRREAPPDMLETCVMLEDLQDPGNLGSILRSCAAAGVKQIFLSKASVNAWSPRVLRAAMGAHFSVAVYERMDLSVLAARFPGRVLVTRADAGQTLFEAELSGKVAFVFGNEGAGVSELLARHAQGAVAIPMPGAAESLNVAAAAAICLFERVRRMAKNQRENK
jgi:TrmH family RNA methyltransferase